MKSAIWFGCMLVLVVLTACNDVVDEPVEQGAVKLAFNFAKDSTYRYSIKNNIAINQQIDEDNTITINQNMTLVSDYKVLAYTSDKRTVAVTYERITMSSGNQAFSIDYDSENDNGTEAMYEDLRNLIDKTFKMTVSARGEILSAEPVIQSRADGQGAYHFDDSSIRKIMMHALEVYPDRDVSSGDVWENTYTTSVGFANVTVKNRYRLLSVDNEQAHIELQGRLSTDMTEQAQNSSMTLNGIQSGTFDMVLSSGLIQSAKIKQELSGEMDITGTNTPVTVESDIYIMGVVKQP